MHDLTEARPAAQTVTAQEIIDAAQMRERMAICDFLNGQAFQFDSQHMDTIMLLRDAIKAGAHR